MTDITAETPTASPPLKRQAKKNSSPTSGKQSKKSAPTQVATTNAPDTWQQYVRDEFSDASLAEAVAEVMQQHEKKVLEITTIINAIFTNDIPKEARSMARERVSNVVSVGANSIEGNSGSIVCPKQQLKVNSRT